jgi:hypothetical protein
MRVKDELSVSFFYTVSNIRTSGEEDFLPNIKVQIDFHRTDSATPTPDNSMASLSRISGIARLSSLMNFGAPQF